MQKGRTIDPDGLNIRELRNLLILLPFIMLFHYFILPYAYL